MICPRTCMKQEVLTFRIRTSPDGPSQSLGARNQLSTSSDLLQQTITIKLLRRRKTLKKSFQTLSRKWSYLNYLMRVTWNSVSLQLQALPWIKISSMGASTRSYLRTKNKSSSHLKIISRTLMIQTRSTSESSSDLGTNTTHCRCLDLQMMMKKMLLADRSACFKKATGRVKASYSSRKERSSK